MWKNEFATADVLPKKNMGFRFGFETGLKPKNPPNNSHQTQSQTQKLKNFRILKIFYSY